MRISIVVIYITTTSHANETNHTHPFIPVVPEGVCSTVEAYAECKGTTDNGGEEDAYKNKS